MHIVRQKQMELIELNWIELNWVELNLEIILLWILHSNTLVFLSLFFDKQVQIDICIAPMVFLNPNPECHHAPLLVDKPVPIPPCGKSKKYDPDISFDL